MADKVKDKAKDADELEKYLNDDVDSIFASDKEDEEVDEDMSKEIEKEEVETVEKEEESNDLDEPELTDDEEEKVTPKEIPDTEEDEEDIEVEEKTKEEFEEDIEKEIKEEEKKEEVKEAPKAEKPKKEREKMIIEKISCDSLAIINGYLIGISAIEFAFFFAMQTLLSSCVVIRTGLDGFFENSRSILLQSLECFAVTIILFLVASLFNNLLKERKGKIGLTILLLGEMILIGCFLAEIIVVARAVLLM